MGPRQASSVSFDSTCKAASCTLSSGWDGRLQASRVSQAHLSVFAELTFVAATPDDLHWCWQSMLVSQPKFKQLSLHLLRQ